MKRQAIAIGATLLGGYVLNNEWEWIKDELGIGSGNVESGLVHDVKGNDDHLKILGTHVDGLEKATMKLRHQVTVGIICLLYTSPSPRDLSTSRMPSSA